MRSSRDSGWRVERWRKRGGAGLPLELASSKNPFIESLKELVPQLVPERLRSPELQKTPVESEKRTFFPGIRKRRTA